MRVLLVILITIIFLAGCSEKYELETDNQNVSIIIEGEITNDTLPNYVCITKGVKLNEYSPYKKPTVVKNAIVIISDNFGNRDTLIPSDEYYKTTSLRGVCGRTYHLYVKIDNIEYYANAEMPNVVPIDSMQYDTSDVYTPPIIYFNDPQEEKNFYIIRIPFFTNDKSFMLLDDRLLSNTSFQGVILDGNDNPDFWKSYSNHIAWGIKLPFKLNLTISLSSITRDTYLYYSSLEAQINSDGGIYSPSPSTPKGNISNGALGYFQASAVSYISKKIK